MINSIPLDWSAFKTYVDSNLVLFKSIEDSRSYQLFMADGALVASCLIFKDGGADQLEFEASYKSRANKGFFYYATPVNIRQTSTTAANATVWAMRNAANSTKSIIIEKIILMMSFDAGTPIGRSLQRYNIMGFNGATPTGGTSQGVAPLDNNNPATQVTDVRFSDTGLSTTGAAFGNSFLTIGCPATDATTAPFKYDGPPIKLAPGEGLAIRLAIAAVIGEGLTGGVIWSER